MVNWSISDRHYTAISLFPMVAQGFPRLLKVAQGYPRSILKSVTDITLLSHCSLWLPKVAQGYSRLPKVAQGCPRSIWKSVTDITLLFHCSLYFPKVANGFPRFLKVPQGYECLKLLFSSKSLHAVPEACMQFQGLACSSKSLHAVLGDKKQFSKFAKACSLQRACM